MRITHRKFQFVVVKFYMVIHLSPQVKKFSRTTSGMASVEYNSELQNFSISSGTTGEAIAANGAIGVSSEQKASNIQVGRYAR